MANPATANRWTHQAFSLTFSPHRQARAQRACIIYHHDKHLFESSFFFVLMSTPLKSTPLVAPGHTRPITHLSFSPIQDDGTFLLVSSCKDGNPMLREWTGDWIGTFLGHKGAVWSTKLSLDGSRAASGSADFTAWVIFLFIFPLFRCNLPCWLYNIEKFGTHTREIAFILSPIIT